MKLMKVEYVQPSKEEQEIIRKFLGSFVFRLMIIFLGVLLFTLGFVVRGLMK